MLRNSVVVWRPRAKGNGVEKVTRQVVVANKESERSRWTRFRFHVGMMSSTYFDRHLMRWMVSLKVGTTEIWPGENAVNRRRHYSVGNNNRLPYLAIGMPPIFDNKAP